MEFRHEDRPAFVYEPAILKPLYGLAVPSSFAQAAVVRIKFTENRVDKTGTGFFLHIPGSTARLILTSAHNLLSHATGLQHSNIRITVHQSSTAIPIKPEWIRISASFSRHPEAAPEDYGAILVPRTVDVPNRVEDFGFSLALAYENTFNSPLSLTGHRTSGYPDAAAYTRAGPYVDAPDGFHYQIAHESGMDGSPVWIGYKRYPTVIGIHCGISSPSSKSKSVGSRITPRLLRDLFTWTSTLLSGVSLTIKPIMAGALAFTMIYSPDDNTFRVAVGDHGAPDLTQIDVCHSYAAPSSCKIPAKVTFSRMRAGKEVWMSFDNHEGSPGVLAVEDPRKVMEPLMEGSVMLKEDFKMVHSSGGNEFIVCVDSSILKDWEKTSDGITFPGIIYRDPSDLESDPLPTIFRLL